MTPDTLRAILETHRLAVLEASSPWCTVETAAIHLRVSRSEIYKLRRAGKLRAYGIPGKSHVRFKREELDRLMHGWSSYTDEHGNVHGQCIDWNEISQKMLQENQKLNPTG